MALQQFFYDKQIRRYIIQFIRLISNFQVEFGKDRNGVTALQRVPVIYGDSSRQAMQILKGNSENTLNTVPAMAVYISALTYDRERVLNPYHEGAMRIREQMYNPETQSYTGAQDGIYTANWALIKNGKAIMSRLPSTRKIEEGYALEQLQKLKIFLLQMKLEKFQILESEKQLHEDY